MISHGFTLQIDGKNEVNKKILFLKILIEWRVRKSIHYKDCVFTLKELISSITTYNTKNVQMEDITKETIIIYKIYKLKSN